MLDVERTAIAHMDREWPKGLPMQNIAQLLDGHDRIVSCPSSTGHDRARSRYDASPETVNQPREVRGATSLRSPRSRSRNRATLSVPALIMRAPTNPASSPR